MFSDLIRICASYLPHMGMRTVGTSGGRYVTVPTTPPQRYHRVVSALAWLGLLASGLLCWALILSSI
jgi:hypothetical protein